MALTNKKERGYFLSIQKTHLCISCTHFIYKIFCASFGGTIACPLVTDFFCIPHLLDGNNSNVFIILNFCVNGRNRDANICFSLSLTPSGIQTARNTPRRPKRNIFESARCGKPSLSRIHWCTRTPSGFCQPFFLFLSVKHLVLSLDTHREEEKKKRVKLFVYTHAVTRHDGARSWRTKQPPLRVPSIHWRNSWSQSQRPLYIIIVVYVCIYLRQPLVSVGFHEFALPNPTVQLQLACPAARRMTILSILYLHQAML